LENTLLIFIPIIILLIAASPVIVLFAFSELMAAKEGTTKNDAIRQAAKYIGWLFLMSITLFVIYGLFQSHDEGRFHLRSVFEVINAALNIS
jgi:ABC-type multidrug transport system permease subunit